MKKLNSVILIDDDLATNYYNSKIIRNAACTETVIVYESGIKALEFLKSQNETSLLSPGLILLDINMPTMNGWEFIEAYNKLDFPQKAKMVLVVLSASLNVTDKEKALEMGAEGFMQKPMLTAQLKDFLKERMS